MSENHTGQANNPAPRDFEVRPSRWPITNKYALAAIVVVIAGLLYLAVNARLTM